MNEYPQGIWNATEYFKHLTATNRLAKSEGFTFCSVSGLDANGYTELHNTPRTRRVKTVFLAMRHRIDDMKARNTCMDTLREVFRQFMSKLILEKTKLENHCIYIDPRISFNEIDRYFFSGCACAYFQIAVDVYTDLRINPDEWNE